MTMLAPRVERRKVADRSPHHVANAARLLARRRGLRSVVAAQRQMDRAHAVLADLGAVAREHREVAEWLRGWMGPGLAALHDADARLPLQDLCDAKMAADAREDLSLQRCAVDASPEHRRRLAADLRTEMARSTELLAGLESAECGAG